MRENKSKREGLGMGTYRNSDHHLLTQGIDWVKEGEWATSLGVPVGNDLDTEKWWKQKLKAVKKHASRWVGLFKSSYFGRNLVVQGMFFGRLRYWLFSLPISESLINQIQAYADILWWSKEPDINTTQQKRFRRFVTRLTAIGTRAQGGLGNMDWKSHVKAFQAQWILRYACDPADSSWKQLLDTLILVDNTPPEGFTKFAEGRCIFFAKLPNTAKKRLIMDLPAKSKYIRACMKSFWELNIQPDLKHENTLRHIGAEPLFYNSRFNLHTTQANREYFTTVTNASIISDIMNG